MYRIKDSGNLAGFVLFYVDYIPEESFVKIGGKTFPGGTRIIKGELRCSGVKGIGKAIQGDMEDFAKHNKIPLIQIEASNPQQETIYIKENLVM